MKAIFKEFYGTLEKSEQENCELCASNDFNILVDKAKNFLEKVEEILERAGVELPVYALFVSPSDLLKADNMDNKGIVQISRV